MEWVIGAFIVAGIIAKLSGDADRKKKIEESRSRPSYPRTSRGFDPTPRKCRGCGEMVVDLTTCPFCDTYNYPP